MRTPAASALALTAVLAAIAAIGCGITVIIPGETNGDGGQGAAAGLGGGGESSGGGGSGGEITKTPTAPDGCAVKCSVPPANQTCTCTHACDDSFPPAGKVSCAPIVDLQGTHKIECVCTISDQFSGVCFETNEAVLCNFDEGCCAKYFSGK